AQASLIIYLAESRFAARTLGRIRALLGEPPQSDPDDVPALSPPLSAAGVDFSYPEGDVPALRGVDATFAPSTVTALVGPSGSGKSTLAQLLVRLWDPEVGAIRFGEIDIRAVNRSHIYRHLAIVFQDVTLFSETVRDNIRLARPDASHAEVEAAARRAQAHDFITALPDGYDTVLGPGQTELSGGERQRISIARALMKDAPVLVLDEATASLDSASELAVQRAIAELMEDRTVIVIAHRLWTVQDVDQIVVLDGGRVVQTGSHAALVEDEGLYRAMWRAQQRVAGA
ncbi:MAG: ATP-binding cassette domain-containing protein, partial [Myxococcota bacterium]